MTQTSTAIFSARLKEALSTFPGGASLSSWKNLIESLPAKPFERLFDWNGDFKLGPIPKGFPINLAASYQPLADLDRATAEERAMHGVNFAFLIKTFLENWPNLDLSADDTTLLAWGANLRANRCC